MAEQGTNSAILSEDGKPLLAARLDALRADTVLDFDIYIQFNGAQRAVLYRERHLQITADVLERLRGQGVEQVYVCASDARVFQQYVESNLAEILEDERIPVGYKTELLYDSAQGLLQDVFAEPRSGRLIERSRELAATSVKFLVEERTAFSHLLQVVSYDYYTYTHSVNVFAFCIALAQRCGVAEMSLLREFGDGALLHDLGKSLLDPAIINCRGRLTGAQWEEMKKHPVYSYELLREHDHLGSMALDVARHHHEKLNGKGYPDGLADGDISFFVRISTVCDIFDALTTKRSYKPAMDSFPARKLMREVMSDELDPDIFRTFVQMMGNPEGA